MNCPSCGKTIPDESSFCNFCGAPVSQSAPVEKQAGVTVSCARCGGTGQLPKLLGPSNCPACQGKGTVLVADPPRKCLLCGGSGYQEGFVNKPICGVCWGTGWADVLK
jgi:DnaJ-class molecular chaperone